MLKQVLLFLAMFFSMTASSFGQSRIQVTSTVERSISLNGFAREFWLSLITNHETQAGKYYQMYVTSARETTVNVGLGKATPQTFSINALQVLVYDIPLAWELRGSGIPEDKAIHVWSEDADLNVNLLSRIPSTSGALTAVPVAAWGTEYVVASFASYAYLPGYEYPSEFSIVADQDNTLITIVPSADLRHGFSTAVAYPRFQPFTITLQRGQTVEYLAAAANGDMDNFDLTGTVISSNKPVGVIGGVQCANIPASSPYCDHICEMLLPVDRWGKHYISAPFAKRKGGDGFLIIAAEDNTTITRTSNAGTRTHAVLNRFEHYMRHDIDEASEWVGNKPFMLVQYINGTDYPDQGANDGIGDPAMVVLPPVESFVRSALLQTPKIRSAEVQFRNYVNIILHKDALNGSTFEGHAINASSLAIANSDYRVYRLDTVSPGAHVVTSDSNFGVYTYGYGSYDAYAAPGATIGSFSLTSSDTLPPVITEKVETCYSARIALAELQTTDVGDLQLSVDSTLNAKIGQILVSGSKRENISYQFSVTDSTMQAYARIVVADAAGNRRNITHVYTPDLPSVPLDQPLMFYAAESSTREFAIAVKGMQLSAVTDLVASLKYGDRFAITSAPTSLDAGEVDSVRLTYAQIGNSASDEVLLLTAECWRAEIPLRGVPEPFTAMTLQDTSISFGTVIIGETSIRGTQLLNVGTESFQLDSIRILPTGSFSLVSPMLPMTLTSNKIVNLTFEFSPTVAGPSSAIATLYTSAGSRELLLTGEGKPVADVPEPAASVFQIYPNPAKDLLIVRFSDPERAIVGSVRVVGVSGKEFMTIAIERGLAQLEVDIQSLPAGSYFIEIRLGDEVLSRKFTVIR